MKSYFFIILANCVLFSTLFYPKTDDGRKRKPICYQGQQDQKKPLLNQNIDSTPADSSLTPVLQPIDPNEIIGPDGWIAFAEGDTVRWINATQSLPYTIYFENDPELATAAAQVVTVRLKLHPLMNIADFRVGAFGFGNHVFPVEGTPLQYQARLDLTSEMNLYVDVVAGIDITTNEAFWIFSSIDPSTGVAPIEVERGFLAVNDSTHIGEGYVTFSIKPKTALCLTGDTIDAQASIVFDNNDPIETNRWVNTIDAVAPTSSCIVQDAGLVPAAQDSLRVVFSGEDDTTGIVAYRLYYNENSGAFRLAGHYPAGDTAVIEQQPNTKYTFFSLSEDYVGNIEPMKNAPDTLLGNTYFQLFASVQPEGSASITGTGSYPQGDTAILTVHPSEGYRLMRWTEGGMTQGTDTLMTLVAAENHTFTVEMERISYPLIVDAAEGTSIAVTTRTTTGNLPAYQEVHHFDTLDIQIGVSPCYSEVSFLLNNTPLTSDTMLVVLNNVTLSSTATPLVDTGYVYDTICPYTAYTANGFNILSSSTANAGSSNYQLITNNSRNCDSVVVLHLTIKPFHSLTFLANGGEGTMPNQQVCDGEETVLNSNTFIREGFFFAGWATSDTSSTIQYADGGIITLFGDQTLYAIWSSNCVNLESNRIVTACDNYTWNDSTYTTSGEYTRTSPDVVPGGCDSIYRLHLTVKHSTEKLQQITTCHPFTWIDGQTYFSDTTRQFSMTNSVGCDSVIILNLSVLEGITNTETITACDSYTWNGTTYTSTCTPSYTTVNSLGCDSTVTLFLTINNSTTNTETVTACDNYTWHGTTYYSSTNIPTITTTNSMGCDSVTNLHLTINSSSYSIETVAACNNYIWHGNSYSSSTTSPTFSTTNSVGCDSIITLHLTISESLSTIENITACDSFTWHGTTYTTSTNTPSYSTTSSLGCDSTVSLYLTVNHGNAGVETVSACDNYIWHGTEYNASTNTPTFTSQNIDGCDSVTTLNLTIHQSSTGIDIQTACDSIIWHGISYTTSTNSHSFDTTNVNGCDSTIILHLTINNSSSSIETATACDSYTWHGNSYTSSTNTPIYSTTNSLGCDSTVTLHLTINNSTSATETVTACDSFTWHDSTYTCSTFNSQFSTLNSVGCDSTITLHLTINNNSTSTETVVACDTYTWHGTTYTASTNAPSYHITNATGCDSMITLHLTINNSTTCIETVNACDIYSWHGTSYTASTNTPTYQTINAAGCDSTVTLHLTINNSTTSIETTTSCDSYTWHDTVYTASTSTSTFITTNTVGCDSTVTLHLTINYSTASTETVTSCDSYTWNGTTFSISTIDSSTSTNSVGCDSLTILHLTINYSTSATENITACDSYTWHGIVYTVSAIDSATTTNAQGCDSVTTLYLTVNYSSTATDNQSACDSYTWIDGNTYTASTNEPTITIPNQYDCDSVISLNLTINYSSHDTIVDSAVDSYEWQGNTYTESGEYVYNGQTEDGCDSIIVLQLTITELGISSIDSVGNITVYPNPTTGKLTIIASNVANVEVFDQNGRIVASFLNTNEIDIHYLPTGVYTLRITLHNGTIIKRVIKQ